MMRSVLITEMDSSSVNAAASSAEKEYLFTAMPVNRAVISLAVPTVISQIITVVYNMADTFFIGQMNDPNQVAAATISMPLFIFMTALANLFGIGGASLIARLLGAGKPDKAKEVSAFCFYGGLLSAAVFGAAVGIFNEQILILCGARGMTLEYAKGYVFYTLTLGAVPTVLTTLLTNLVRSEGAAAAASFGAILGCIVNIALDPIFVLPWGLNMGAAGAGAATAISNAAGLAFFICYIIKKRGKTVLGLNPALLSHSREHAGAVLRIGAPSALQYALTVVAVSAQMNFVAKYGNEAVAAVGITKKLDQLPLYFSIGAANGMLPLIGYNYAAKKFKRTEDSFRFGCIISLSFALFCVVIYEIFAPGLASLFIKNEATVKYAAAFLRRMVLAMPLMSLCYPLIIKFQAMGKAKESITVSILRKGVLDIPLYFMMDALFPLYGCMWVQPIVDTLSLGVAAVLNRRIVRHDESTRLEAEKNAE